MTAWMDDAKCAGVRDFTEWPEASRAVLCDACPVKAECTEWMGRRYATQYCPHGHDKDELGRTPEGRCLACQRGRKVPEGTPRSHTRPKRKQPLPGMCPNDHDKTKVGVDSRGICKECRREAWRRYAARRAAV